MKFFYFLQEMRQAISDDPHRQKQLSLYESQKQPDQNFTVAGNN